MKYNIFNKLKKIFSYIFKKHQDDGCPEINVAIPKKPDYELIEYMRQRKLMAHQFEEELKSRYYFRLWEF